MPPKEEVAVYTELSGRQRSLYRAIRDRIALEVDPREDVVGLSDKRLQNLMNIVVQLRKVCNHPELFERREARSPFHMAPTWARVPPLPPFGLPATAAFTGGLSEVRQPLPRLAWRQLPPSQGAPCGRRGFEARWQRGVLSIWHPEHVHRSATGGGGAPPLVVVVDDRAASSALASTSAAASAATRPSVARSGAFGWSRLAGLAPHDVSFLAAADGLRAWMWEEARGAPAAAAAAALWGEEHAATVAGGGYGALPSQLASRLLVVEPRDCAAWLREPPPEAWVRPPPPATAAAAEGGAGARPGAAAPGEAAAASPSPSPLPPLPPLVLDSWRRLMALTPLLRAAGQAYIPAATAPQPQLLCSDAGFAARRAAEAAPPLERWALLGCGPAPACCPAVLAYIASASLCEAVVSSSWAALIAVRSSRIWRARAAAA